MEVDGGVLLCAAAPHRHGAGTRLRRRLDRGSGGEPTWLLSLAGQGVQISLPSSCPRASSALPRQAGAASLECGGCPATEPLDPLRYRPRSLLLQHREPVEGARGGCLSAVPGLWRPPGHESSSQPRGTANPSPPSPLLGPLQCPPL